MRHLITEPQDAYHWEPSEQDWEDFWSYCLECEMLDQQRAFEEANLELMAMDCPL